MKSRKYFVSIILLLICSVGYCCGPYWNSPEEYYIYRVYDGKGSALSRDNKERNLKTWKDLYPAVSTSQIEELVYKWDLTKLENLDKNKSSNTFAKAICDRGDKEVADYLVTAKKCEVSCAERASKWYYPFKNNPDIAALDTVIQNVMSYDSDRLYDRYMLQAVRAMFSLSRYDEIISLWKASEKKIKEGVIRDMIVGYVAGATCRTGDRDKAIDYYLSVGDYESIRFLCAKTVEGVKVQTPAHVILALYAERCPDSPEIPHLLQETFYGFEDRWYDMGDYYRWTDLDYKQRMTVKRGDPEFSQKCYEICMKAVSKSKSPAVWYYTAAFLKDLLGNPYQASLLLSKAEKTNSDDFLGNSIKVFRMYLDAKTSVYDSSYEKKLFSQLQWLDEKIISELDAEIKEKTSQEPYLMHSGFSYYYWNDMLRKIIIGEVCPRMEDAGKPVMALRLMNMADNRLVNRVDKRLVTWYTWENHKYVEHEKTESMSEYRKDAEHTNDHDYSNYFFDAMDRIPIASLVRYAVSAGNPTTTFEKFLDERSYIDKDFLYELVGTRYLREQQYNKAVTWLSKVSESYQGFTNIKWYMTRDPFVLEAPKGYFNKNYKLSFAKKMCSLQSDIDSCNQDIRGEALVKMGTGIRSSYTNCWSLTQYHKFYDDDWITSEETRAAIANADDMIAEGLRTIIDPEKAAQAYLSQYLYLSVAEKFPDTQVCKKMKAQCDKLYDHKKSVPMEDNL